MGRRLPVLLLSANDCFLGVFEMHDHFDSPHAVSDLANLFPVPSQTSSNDKLFLLGSMRLARKTRSYAYLEIGSFRGGSLTPFLKDPACKMVLSIDERGRVQPDERGVSYDYSGITTQSMRDELNRCGIGTEKLRTFDGSIHALTDNYTASFDVAFIDGEHTDEACFRDFLWTLPLMKSDAVIMFHDSSLIYKSLKLIMVYLDKTKIAYTFFKRADSAMSALLFGNYCNMDHVQYFGTKEDPSVFFSWAEAFILECQFQNRARFRFAPTKLLKLQIPLAIDIERPKIEKV
jgi:predicted O-methyltransferase YrrM